MGVKRAGRNLAGLDLAHDFGKIIRLGVTAGDQRCLALVEFRVGEGDVLADDGEQHVACAVS
ncbi:hypothetical protein D3C73_623660 [compost metagenome]